MRLVSYARWAVLALAFVLCACTNVQLVDRYDLAIETGINKYHKDVVKFLKQDEPYTSAQAKEFYSSAAADLANIVMRAQVVAVGNSCEQPKFMEAVIVSLRGGLALGGAPADADVSLSSGSCTVVALKVLQANHARLEALHQRNGRLGAFRSALASGIIGDSVRIALIIEAAKRPG